MKAIHYAIGAVLLTCALFGSSLAGAVEGEGDKSSNGTLSEQSQLQMPHNGKAGLSNGKAGAKKALPVKKQKVSKLRSPAKDRVILPILLFGSSKNNR